MCIQRSVFVHAIYHDNMNELFHIMTILQTVSILILITRQCYCFQGIINRVPFFVKSNTFYYETKQNSWTTAEQESKRLTCCCGSHNHLHLIKRRFLLRGVRVSFESHDNDNTVVDVSKRAQETEVASSSDSLRLASASIESNTMNSSRRSYSICEYHTVSIPTSYVGLPNQSVIVEDLTPIVNGMIQQCGIIDGLVTICSRHTTTSITINEYESRLIQDIENLFLTKIIPPDRRSISRFSQQSNMTYYHNDIHLRPESDIEKQRCFDNGWNITNPETLQEWRDQEPINAHSHLLSMMIGSTESIPIHDSKMILGQWQSILLIDFDGPRNRTVGIQFMGFQ